MNKYNTMKYEQNDKPLCPYCDHEQCDENFDDNCDYVTSCENCYKEFNIEKVVSYKYTTLGKPCAVHRLKLLYETDKHKQYYCTECKRKYYDWEMPDGKFPKLKTEQFIMEN